MNPYNEAIVTSEVGDEAVMRKVEGLARCVGARAIAMGGSISGGSKSTLKEASTHFPWEVSHDSTSG
jgi:hypothetical protein